jgi:kynurenine formamidase
MKNIIDLTLTYRADMRGVNFETVKTIEKDGWNAKILNLYSHAGTHMDAPLHFGVGDETIEQIPLERCMGQAWIADISSAKPSQLIKPADLGNIIEFLSEGESLLIKTGWSKRLYTPEYRDKLPRISKELAEWCVKKKVKILGVEPPSVADVNNKQELTEIHKILLEGGIVIVEGLCNLDKVSSQKVNFMALPLKIFQGDGAPCRAFALTE